MGYQHVIQRAHPRKHHRTMRPKRLHQSLHITRIGDQDQLAPQLHVHQQADRQRKDVVERQRPHKHRRPLRRRLAGLIHRRMEPRTALQHIRHHVAVRQHRPPRHTGRPARVLQKGQILSTQLGRLERQILALPHHLSKPDSPGQVERRNRPPHMTQHHVHRPALQPSQQISHRGQDNLTDQPLRPDLLHRVRKILQNHQHIRTGIPQLVLQLSRRIERIHIHRRHPRSQRPQQRHHIGMTVGHHQRDT